MHGFPQHSHSLPVMKKTKKIKIQSVSEGEDKASLTGSAWRSALWEIVGRVKWYCGCLHGPKSFETEIPVTILTCLFGLSNGYLTSVLMILAPKIVKLQHGETARVVIVLFLVIGLAAGSIVAWLWVI